MAAETFVNLTDDKCDPGKFLDTLAPDVRAKAGTVDATAKPQLSLAAVVSDLACVLRYVHSNGGLSRVEHRMATEALAQFDEWMGGTK